MPPLLENLARRYEAQGKLFQLTVDLTRRCDLRCAHCYLDPNRRRDQASTALVLQALAQARELDAVCVLLTGGEPLLHPDWQQILQASRDHRLFTTLYTHAGHIDDATAVELRDLLVIDVGVSFYSMDPAVHDSVTGVPGSWRRTRRGIEALVRAGVPVSIKTPLLHGLNHQGAMAVAEWAEALGGPPRVTFGVGLAIAPGEDGSPDPCRFNLPIEESARVLRALDARTPRSQHAAGARPGASERLQAPPCRAGSTNLYLAPDGQVRACLELRESLGHLGRETLGDIWARVQARRRRGEELHLDRLPACRDCDYLQSCTPCVGLAEQQVGQATEPAPLCCAQAYARALARLPEGAAPPPPPSGLRR